MTTINILSHATPHADAIIERMKAERMPGLSLSLRVRDYNRETVNALGAALEHSERGERLLHCPGILPSWEGIYQPVPLVLTPIPAGFTAKRRKGRGRVRARPVLSYLPDGRANGLGAAMPSSHGALPDDMATTPHGWRVGIVSSSLEDIDAGKSADMIQASDWQ